MSYYHDQENAEGYVKMAEGYDGRELIERLKVHLQSGSTVLELGMGPGSDLEILAEDYTVTGSDYSPIFVERYRGIHPDADLIVLDAVTLETKRQFDCIYSNKVLQHLTADELATSLREQVDMVNDGGVLLHSFWVGDMVEQMHGLTFIYYTEETLAAVIPDTVEVLESQRYTEMDADDSIYIILRKKPA